MVLQHAPISIKHPRAGGTSYKPTQVAKAYNYPLQFTGKGQTCGIIELGGGFGTSDLVAYGIDPTRVRSVLVAGGKNKSDGPNGADGEVLLDIEIVASIAPGANINVYFAPNTDAGFLAAIKQAVAECGRVSISWGGPESEWDGATMDAYDAVFLQARKRGVTVYCASGDSGSSDGTTGTNVDFPASSPNVIGCGGTRLTINPDGTRATETVWNDNPTSSATGGGISKHFPGRNVPDVAGNADPQTGYDVIIDGGNYIIGGTSAVAPLYAGLDLLLSEAIGQPLGSKVDLMNTLLTNLGVVFDVTAGNNGAFRAGPGRDNTTGLGVVDGGLLLKVLTDNIPDPLPIGTVPPTPTPPPVTDTDPDDIKLADAAIAWLAGHPMFYKKTIQAALRTWLAKKGF